MYFFVLAQLKKFSRRKEEQKQQQRLRLLHRCGLLTLQQTEKAFFHFLSNGKKCFQIYFITSAGVFVVSIWYFPTA